MADLTTGTDVCEWLNITTSAENIARYAEVAAVADEHVRSFCTIPDVVPDALKMAATMLAARIAKRKETPQGVGSLGGEDIFYVAKTDPDIVSLLAPYKKFGFA